MQIALISYEYPPDTADVRRFSSAAFADSGK
jgi:hypothetical protein